MATQSFTKEITFEAKDVDNLIKALENNKKPKLTNIKAEFVTDKKEIKKLLGMKIVSLQSLLEYTDEGSIKKNFLENFKSIETNDIEIFLHEKAIKYEKDSISSTHLVFNENGTLVGYFSIANKGLVITEHNYKILSNTQKRKLTYSGRKLENSVYIVNSYLLGQIGKNYNIPKEERGY